MQLEGLHPYDQERGLPNRGHIGPCACASVDLCATMPPISPLKSYPPRLVTVPMRERAQALCTNCTLWKQV